MVDTPLENALYRIRSYQSLMAAEHGDKPQSTAADLKVLLDWIDYARPLLGAVSPQPKGDFIDQARRGTLGFSPAELNSQVENAAKAQWYNRLSNTAGPQPDPAERQRPAPQRYSRVSSATSDVNADRLAAEQAEQHERPDERPADDFGRAAAATGEPPKAT